MTKQTINLLGGLAVGAILAAGLFLGALPRWQAAQEADDERGTVVTQNQSQELVIASMRERSDELGRLRSQVKALRKQVPAEPDLEQVVALGVRAEREGAVLRSVSPTAAEDAAQPAPEATAPTTGGFEEVPVTIVIDLRRPDSVPTVLDALRDGPRRLAIDSASLAGSEGEEGATYALTVSGRVFVAPEDQSAGQTTDQTTGGQS